MSGDAEQEYFSDGMTEDLITDLSKVSALFVIARNSSFAYKGKAVKVQEIGRELGVRFVLEGSIRKVGNRVRVTAQLVDAGSGGHLWADRFDRDLTDIFATQDEVVQKIVSALAVKLTRGEERRLRRGGTRNVEAYEAWLRARELLARGTRDAVVQSRAMHRRAIEIDPNFAAPHAGLAFGVIADYVNAWTAEPEQPSRKPNGGRGAPSSWMSRSRSAMSRWATCCCGNATMTPPWRRSLGRSSSIPTMPKATP